MTSNAKSNFSQTAFIAGAFLGLTGVIAGAMGAHALEKVLPPDMLDAFKTGVRFQMYHAFGLLLLGILFERYPSKSLRWAIGLFLVGSILFSGSIYLLALTPLKVGIVTPIGGTLLIVGWGMLLLWAVRKR
ncbi:MAG: DUF423 domain-containing protein [Bacteroidota bacterium]